MEFLNKLKTEGVILAAFYIVFGILMQYLFYNEEFLSTLRVVSSIFWLFILPGFVIMYHWHDKMDFTERLIMGTVLGLAIMGVFSYNFGLLGLNLTTSAIIFPIISLALGAFIINKELKRKLLSP